MPPMAIRFPCQSCAQPIEVDDEWADKRVACPYCHNTVTAPILSTLHEVEEIPSARPLESSTDTGAAYVHPGGVSRGTMTNRLAVVAFAIMLSSLAMMFAGMAVLSPHSLELTDFQKRLLAEMETDGGSQWKVMDEFRLEHGGDFPTWFILGGALHMSAMACCVGALVCGLISMRRPVRRGMAITSVFVSGGLLLLICGGGQLL